MTVHGKDPHLVEELSEVVDDGSVSADVRGRVRGEPVDAHARAGWHAARSRAAVVDARAPRAGRGARGQPARCPRRTQPTRDWRCRGRPSRAMTCPGARDSGAATRRRVPRPRSFEATTAKEPYFKDAPSQRRRARVTSRRLRARLRGDALELVASRRPPRCPPSTSRRASRRPRRARSSFRPPGAERRSSLGRAPPPAACSAATDTDASPSTSGRGGGTPGSWNLGVAHSAANKTDQRGYVDRLFKAYGDLVAAAERDDLGVLATILDDAYTPAPDASTAKIRDAQLRAAALAAVAAGAGKTFAALLDRGADLGVDDDGECQLAVVAASRDARRPRHALPQM